MAAEGVVVRSTAEEEKKKVREIEEGEIEDEYDGAAGDDNDPLTSTAGIEGAAPPQLHPLEHSWTFWFDNPSLKLRQAAWGSSIRTIHTFSNVEDFWSLYNNIPHPSKLAVRADFYCFKDKIEPKWEDPICANGGKWILSCARGKSDTLWLYTLLAMIGEQFDYGDEICGAVVSVRMKIERISIWTKNASNEAAQIRKHCDKMQNSSVPNWNHLKLSIGKQWKEFLDHHDTIDFIFHDDAKKLDRSAKNRYTV